MKQNNKKDQNTHFLKCLCLKKLLNISDATYEISPLLFYAWVEIAYRVQSWVSCSITISTALNWRFLQKKEQQAQSSQAIFWN